MAGIRTNFGFPGSETYVSHAPGDQDQNKRLKVGIFWALVLHFLHFLSCNLFNNGSFQAEDTSVVQKLSSINQKEKTLNLLDLLYKKNECADLQ